MPLRSTGVGVVRIVPVPEKFWNRKVIDIAIDRKNQKNVDPPKKIIIKKRPEYFGNGIIRRLTVTLFPG